MATAACGAQTTSSACTGKLHKEHLRKSRDSRRRRAALLFLTNISLDGRPVLPINDAVAAGQGDIEFEGTNIGSIVTELSPASSSYPNLSSSASCGGVCPVPRLGILNVPPILVLPSDSEYGNVGSTELETTEQESGSISSQGNLLSPSSLQPTPLGQRKSPTLLSVQSCNSSLESRQRTRNLSGSSRPRSLKKVHFIKSMRQYDTRGSRIVLVCAKGSLCAAFSVLPYGESFHISDPALTNQRRRHSSGGISAALEMLPGLEGVELGMYGRTVSYAQFLYPTNVLVCEKPPEMALQMPYSRNSIPHSYPSSRLSSTVGLDLGHIHASSGPLTCGLLSGHDLDRATHFAHHPVKGEALRQMDPAYLQPADPRVASHFVAADAGAHCLLPSVGVPYNSHDTVTYVDSCGPPGFPYRSAVGHVGVAVEAPTIRVIQRPEGVLLAGLAEVPSHQPSADMLTDKSSIGLDDNDYDPNLLSDPQWPCGKHKRVLIFASYMTTVIEYVKPSDLKKDMNETFKEKFPHIKLTLSKIRSLKREMHAAGEECGLQPGSVAMAFAYFEKLVLQGRLSKANRKLVAAACLLLAAKISSDLRKQEVKQLIDKLEEKFRISRRELISFEFTVLVALEMALYLPESKVMPHYRRLAQPASHP